MITDKTVFILGAGASLPYGFPTAAGLRKDIIFNFAEIFIRAHAELYAVDESKVDLPKKFQNLIDIFKNSSTKSIDLFLSRNKHFDEIGKKIIAFLIARYEENSKFREDIEKPHFDWYIHIFDLLTKEISNAEDLVALFRQNKVSFITFNYDRSLEYFLFDSLINSFTTKANEIKALMEMIKVTHVYGKISYLPWEDNYPLLDYGSNNFFGNLEDLANNIDIIFEKRRNNLDDAKQKISEATNIFFLGFGYADENLDVLDFSNLLNKGHRIYGTGLGFTDSERRKVISKLRGKNVELPTEQFAIDACDSVMLLRKHL